MKKLFLLPLALLGLFVSSCTNEQSANESSEQVFLSRNAKPFVKTPRMIAFEKEIIKMQNDMNKKEKPVKQIADEFTIVLKNYLDHYKVNYQGYEGNQLLKLALDTHQKEIMKINQ